MSDQVQTIQLNGESYVVMSRNEYDRLRLLAKAETLPALPAPDKRGTFPAVEYARISLARKIILERARLGLSQAELAKLSGVRVETLCRIETGNVSPSTTTMERIERGFQIQAKSIDSSQQVSAVGKRVITLRNKKSTG